MTSSMDSARDTLLTVEPDAVSLPVEYGGPVSLVQTDADQDCREQMTGVSDGEVLSARLPYRDPVRKNALTLIANRTCSAIAPPPTFAVSPGKMVPNYTAVSTASSLSSNIFGRGLIRPRTERSTRIPVTA